VARPDQPKQRGAGQTGAAWILNQSTVDRFLARVESALARARRTGSSVLASVSQPVTTSIDPFELVLFGRLTGENWTLIEQPERGGSLVTGLGTAVEIRSEGAGRFSDASQQWRELASAAMSDEPTDIPGCGPVALGGFSFSDKVSSTGPWRDYEPASLCVPQISFARRDGELSISINAFVGPDDIADEKSAVVLDRVKALGESLENLQGSGEPRPSKAVRIASALPPEHYEGAVGRAAQRISEGEIEKVVLAREVLVERDQPVDPGHVMLLLREVFPSCFIFGVGRSGSSFVGASPELLVRREGLRASTVALAGSAARSADPAVDDHLGERLLRSAKDRLEQGIVAERIERSLEEVSVWVSSQPEPGLAKIANVQHLATPIRAQLREPVAALELAGRLHPTPAVGGEPWPKAAEVIAELEGLDRGWYAAPIGWTDAAENGEFCVALRCALLQDTGARCYAGVGVVAESNPESELAETELKLQAILPAVTD